MCARVNGLVLSALAFTLALVACGGGGPKLDATRLTLELAYPPTGAPTATLTGQAHAAPGNLRVECRLTQGHGALGAVAAAADGSVTLPLDSNAFALTDLPQQPSAINTLLECRAGNGGWVHPLRPPRVSIG
jgi:hypothetical protein